LKILKKNGLCQLETDYLPSHIYQMEGGTQ